MSDKKDILVPEIFTKPHPFAHKQFHDAWGAAMRQVFVIMGVSPQYEGMQDTPKRVASAWWEMLEGYRQDPLKILGTQFTVGDYDELITVTGEFQSVCEHHLLPFTGRFIVGYLPGPVVDHEDQAITGYRVVGLSKIPRLVRCYAHRFQLQERLTAQIANALMSHEGLVPRGVGVVLRAHHMCMSCRGVRSSGEMQTNVMIGALRTDPNLKTELLHRFNGGH